MASQFEPLARELECGVCLEVLRDPKILDCSHTFCCPCLPGMVESKTRRICCPLCQQSTAVPLGGVGALKSNILARSIVEAMITMNPESIEVGLEATEPTLMQPPPVRPSPIASSLVAPKCLAHPSQTLEFYCIECKLPVCQACTVVDHRPPNHTISNIRGIVKKPTSEINDLVGLLKTEQLKYAQAMRIVKERERDFSSAAARASEDVTTAAEAMIADVRGKQQQLFDQIDLIASARNDAIEKLVMGIHGVLQEVGVGPEEIDTDLESKDDSTIMALYSRIEYSLERLKQTPPPGSDLTDGLSFLKFSAEKTPSYNLHLGDLLENEQWCLDLKFGKYGSRIGEFNCALGIAISPTGDMAVTEQQNHRTCIFGTDGKHKLTMTGKSSGDPGREDRDVAFLSDGRCLILSKSSKIEVYDRNGGHVKSILTPVKNSWCFAVDAKDTTYLGDPEKKLIYVMVDGVVTRQISLAHKPFALAVDNKGHIVVSSMVSKRVDIMSIATGESIFAITSESVDPSNFVSPWGACFGPDGSIFVPFYNAKVFNKGTVHEFGPDGRHLGCVARGFQAPRKLSFTRDGRLIVIDGTSIKLYRKS